MFYSYTPQKTCSHQIQFEIDNGIVKKVSFAGGCNGNLKGIAALVEGLPCEEVVERLKSSFMHSEKLNKHVNFLYAKGHVYKVFNSNILFHGCIPMKENGEFEEITLTHFKLLSSSFSITIISSFEYCFAILIPYAIAWELSKAGIIPSCLDNS